MQIVTPPASPEEAAAVVAAVQRFLADHAPVVVTAPPRRSPWQRAARLESTGREPDIPSPWGDPVRWG